MKLSIKATNGDKNYDYTITREEWLKLTGLAFDAEVQGQKEAKTETKKAGGCVSGFLHAYGVTTEKDTKSMEAGNDSAFPNALYTLHLKGAAAPILTGATHAECVKLKESKGQEGDIFPEDCGDFDATSWLVAWNHSTGRGSNIEGRQKTYDLKAAEMRADGLSEEKIIRYLGKRPEVKA